MGSLVKCSFCVLIVLLLMSSLGAKEVTLAAGVNENPPYVYGRNHVLTEFPGVTIDILRLIESKEDVKFIIKRHPWKRVVNEVKKNEIDGGFHFSFKESRRPFVAYPILEGSLLPDPKYSIASRSFVIYRLKGKSVCWNGEKIVLDSQEANVIAAIRGGSIIDEIKNKDYKLLEVNADNQLIQMLLAKRIDAFVALENMIDPKIKVLGLKDRLLIEKSLPVVVNKPYYIAFSKKFYRENPKLVWRIWTIIDEIKRNGELDKIFAKYIDR